MYRRGVTTCHRLAGAGYLPEDVNMDGIVLYTGANNDRDRLLQAIGGGGSYGDPFGAAALRWAFTELHSSKKDESNSLATLGALIGRDRQRVLQNRG
ncbi:MAG: hypothetical protein IPI72_10140 [Flavobacteriales bacterium]|nr:hypothetical protein [Flavobacteriales bacterium]